MPRARAGAVDIFRLSPVPGAKNGHVLPIEETSPAKKPPANQAGTARTLTLTPAYQAPTDAPAAGRANRTALRPAIRPKVIDRITEVEPAYAS